MVKRFRSVDRSPGPPGPWQNIVSEIVGKGTITAKAGDRIRRVEQGDEGEISKVSKDDGSLYSTLGTHPLGERVQIRSRIPYKLKGVL